MCSIMFRVVLQSIHGCLWRLFLGCTRPDTHSVGLHGSEFLEEVIRSYFRFAPKHLIYFWVAFAGILGPVGGKQCGLWVQSNLEVASGGSQECFVV